MNSSQLVTKIKQLLQHTVFQVLLFVVLAIISYSVLFSNVKPETIEVKLLQVAEETIRAPKTVEDVEKTKADQDEALKQVEDVYALKEGYKENRVKLISSIFKAVEEVKSEADTDSAEGEASQTEQSTEAENAELVKKLKDKLTEEVNKQLSDDVYKALLNANGAQLTVAKDATLSAINDVMSQQIAASDVENARNEVEEMVQLSAMTTELKEASIVLARFAITQNYFYDPVKTEEQRQKALEEVEPTKILQGQVLVEKGDLIDEEVYRNIQLSGLLESDQSITPYIGLCILLLLIFGSIFYYYRVSEVHSEHRNTRLLIFSLVFLFAILLYKLISLLSNYEDVDLSYFAPAAMGAMLLKILLDDRYSIVFILITSIFGGLIFNEYVTTNFNYISAMYLLLSGLVGLLLLTTKHFRTKIFQTGLLLSVVNVVIIFALFYTMDLEISRVTAILYLFAAFVSGISSAILTIGLLPFFEAGFGVLSTMKLIELSSPNHPLLRKILTEAPGTYHHSVMVANLAETACEAIGANGLLARVGCYYHDIGKTKRPQFFIENQMNIDNPHDKLKCTTSRDIIIAHVTDGVKILKKHKMPKEIIDIAEQHHGTTLLKFFYHKAKEAGEDVKEEDFRYPGPKAQTKESAVIGIADSVEAAVRSMKHPTREKIDSLVKSIIHSRMNEDQFSECDITMKELDTVEKILCETLNGIFHSRIEYPDLKNESK
ncbi:HD family phosphohydrolase [Bacillus sp. AGMB 02131]|uniref:HD family phosphohydrolase n=1 Tax=Peribacillus faecalis TaxID=2772559 RepID=A0A927CX50_9BACI|nr:HD family phosphohydrolase [Peribacillus faecalis]MBD3107575.1 HD family phosphohydrolase [Peribacillus faecalis]